MTPNATSVSPRGIDGNIGGPSPSPVMSVRPPNASASVPAPARSESGPVRPKQLTLTITRSG